MLILALVYGGGRPAPSSALPGWQIFHLRHTLHTMLVWDSCMMISGGMIVFGVDFRICVRKSNIWQACSGLLPRWWVKQSRVLRKWVSLNFGVSISISRSLPSSRRCVLHAQVPTYLRTCYFAIRWLRTCHCCLRLSDSLRRTRRRMVQVPQARCVPASSCPLQRHRECIRVS